MDPNSKNIPIPNSLTITINTSVPGYQTIKYKPAMTIKNTDDNTIWFDPLVPLDQSVINKIPESIRVLEFFNKGLFESLINSHGNKKQITLDEAKKKKIIDNNIQVTLNNLFPTNGILYIRGESYAIADVQWSGGHWKIDRKIKEIPEIDVTKISDPITYNKLIKNEILIGNKQLEQLPKDLIYGYNFNKEKDELSSIDREKGVIDIKAEADAKIKAVADAKIKAAADAKLKFIEDARLREVEEAKIRSAKIKKQPVLALENGVKPDRPVLALENGVKPDRPDRPVLALENGVKPAGPVLALENEVKPDRPVLALENEVKPAEDQITPSMLVEDIKNIQMSPDFLPNLQLSQNSTKLLRSYFGNDIFYSMISMIFKYMTEEQKIFVQNIFKNTTNIDVKELSANISKSA